MGGGTRTFTGFDTNTHSFAYQLYEQTKLTRTGPNSYELLSPDGSKQVFAQPDGAIGTARKVFLTRIADPAGNALSFTYDSQLRLVAVTDALGQVTTIAYENPTDIYKVTKITDPFGPRRTAQLRRLRPAGANHRRHWPPIAIPGRDHQRLRQRAGDSLRHQLLHARGKRQLSFPGNTLS